MFFFTSAKLTLQKRATNVLCVRLQRSNCAKSTRTTIGAYFLSLERPLNLPAVSGRSTQILAVWMSLLPCSLTCITFLPNCCSWLILTTLSHDYSFNWLIFNASLFSCDAKVLNVPNNKHHVIFVI